ncbi:carboxymuconolactone decarboxylase family protein [Corynebacterium mastitidis]|uniref:Carboxymuconolactone decarboxylase family protein n=1 Tax=Corynebacterium mastitidis TaxID=161890 RepID=A0ABU8NXM1_9CORY
MSTRPYLDKTHPEIYRALGGAARAARKAYDDAGLGQDIIELINVRVSQINGCPTCLSIHVPAARRAGVSEQALNILPSWRNDASSFFTEEQRAALALAEALTQPQPAPGGDTVAEAIARANAVWSPERVSALEWAIVLINAYNRVSIGSGHPPLS